MSGDLLARLRAATSDEERAWIVQEVSLASLDTDVREAVWAAAVPHWFDVAFLASLISKDEAAVEALWPGLVALSYLEPFPDRGFNVHERTRDLLLDVLWREERDRFRELSRRAAFHCERQNREEEPSWQMEWIYHLLIAEPSLGAEELDHTVRRWSNPPNFAFDRVDALAHLAAEHGDAGRLEEPLEILKQIDPALTGTRIKELGSTSAEKVEHKVKQTAAERLARILPAHLLAEIPLQRAAKILAELPPTRAAQMLAELPQILARKSDLWARPKRLAELPERAEQTLAEEDLQALQTEARKTEEVWWHEAAEASVGIFHMMVGRRIEQAHSPRLRTLQAGSGSQRPLRVYHPSDTGARVLYRFYHPFGTGKKLAWRFSFAHSLLADEHALQLHEPLSEMLHIPYEEPRSLGGFLQFLQFAEALFPESTQSLDEQSEKARTAAWIEVKETQGGLYVIRFSPTRPRPKDEPFPDAFQTFAEEPIPHQERRSPEPAQTPWSRLAEARRLTEESEEALKVEAQQKESTQKTLANRAAAAAKLAAEAAKLAAAAAKLAAGQAAEAERLALIAEENARLEIWDQEETWEKSVKPATDEPS